jgi:hypothetical protein
MLDAEPEDKSSDSGETETSCSMFRADKFLLGLGNNPSGILSLIPPASQAKSYWRIFVENVDPMFHIYATAAWDPSQDLWGCFIDQFQSEMTGDESFCFEERVFKSAGGWW